MKLHRKFKFKLPRKLKKQARRCIRVLNNSPIIENNGIYSMYSGVQYVFVCENKWTRKLVCLAKKHENKQFDKLKYEWHKDIMFEGLSTKSDFQNDPIPFTNKVEDDMLIKALEL